MDYPLINEQLISISKGVDDYISILSNASALLKMELDNINWVGFYLLKGDELILGPFQGQIACTRIPIGKGVCGTAVKERKTQVVDDVHAINNHIACDANSKSEIVIPLFVKEKIIGVLDIDAPIINRFSNDDVIGLTKFARTLEEILISIPLCSSFDVAV